MMQRARFNLFAVSIILICIGLVMIYSVSSIHAWERYKDSFYFFKRHLSFLVVGAILAFFAMSIDYRDLRKFARPLLFFAVVLLILVLIPGVGREVSGARRWFRFKFFSFQPSELAGMCLIIYLADFIARKGKVIKDLSRGLLPPLSVLGVCTLLILMQPDLGTALSISIVALIMLFVAGIRPFYFLSLGLASLPILYALIFRVAYRRARVLAFLNPWIDPQGGGFQIIQSQIALGSGGLLGLGLGHSKQKLFYLPAAHTDFIFSIIGEELGLLGTLGVIALFMIFILQGLKIIKNTTDRFGYFLSLGLVLMISLKAVINIGVSCGLLPTKGLPLPFISYGGTSLVLDMISVGMLLNISRSGEYS